MIGQSTALGIPSLCPRALHPGVRTCVGIGPALALCSVTLHSFSHSLSFVPLVKLMHLLLCVRRVKVTVSLLRTGAQHVLSHLQCGKGRVDDGLMAPFHHCRGGNKRVPSSSCEEH